MSPIVAPGKPEHICKSCPLSSIGRGFVLPDGPVTSPVLLVGEAPGETEATSGRPFDGVAGKLLDRLLRGAGLDRGQFRVANTISCQPPKNYLAGAPWEMKAISSCSPLLEEEIKKTSPRVIVALGNVALRRLTGLSGISRYRGFPIRHPSGAWVLPTYHPSALLPRKGQKENAKLTGLVLTDFLRAMAIATDGFHPDSPHYTLDPRPDTAAVWATEFENALFRGEAKYLSWDIETPGKMKTKEEEDLDADSDDDDDDSLWSTQIIRIGFSYRPGHAMSIPWRPEYLPVIKRLLINPEVEQITWNGYSFDIPVVELNGIQPVAKVIHDGMWAWHMLQSDLPRGLEAVASVYAPEIGPWKHLSKAQPAHYNAIDADAALRNFLGTRKDLEKNDQWKIYQTHVLDLYPILFEAGRVNGVSIDRIAQDELRRILVAERDRLLCEAQRLVPTRPGKKRPKLYTKEKNSRSPMVPVEGIRKVSKCNQCGKLRVNKAHTKKCFGSEIIKIEEKATFWRWAPKWEELDSETLLQAIDEVGFNPDSTQQMQAYANLHGHKVGVDYKTGKAQLNKKVRQSLMKRYGFSHPIYHVSGKLALVKKSLGTYVIGFEPDRKGKIYTTYTLKASTGRLTSRRVNLQNVSHDSRLEHADAIRRTIVPVDPGWMFIECDSSAIEAVCTGFYMNDPDYIRLAHLGIHDYVTCLELGKEFLPEAIGEYRKDKAYEQARDRNKRVVHGCWTKDAEVLTPTGWVTFKDYDWTTPIAEWNPDDRTVEFLSPSGRYQRYHQGEMIRLVGSNFHALVTPDHGFPVLTPAGNVRRYAAKTLPKANSMPVVGTLNTGRVVAPSQIRKLVAIAADGSICGNVARFHLKKSRKITQLKRLGGEFICKSIDRPGAEHWKLVGLPEGLTEDKQFDLTYLLSLELWAREVFLDELPLWDGDGDRIYRTSIESQARIVQTIAHVSGRKVTLGYRPPSKGSFGTRGYWEVRFSKEKKNVDIALESLTRTKIEDFSGEIFCPVTRHGFFLVREAGNICVSGNTSYGMSPKMMCMVYPETFKTEREAAYAQDRVLRAVPRLAQWQHETRLAAHRSTYLQNPWGYRHYYYQVFNKDKSGNVINGPDAKRVVAFLPQSSAAAIMKDTILIIGGSKFKPYMPANLSVHDSICLQVPKGLVDETVEWLAETMTRPIELMGGLRIGCEVKVGKNWGDLEKVKKVSFS